jgi:hypothetical protein
VQQQLLVRSHRGRRGGRSGELDPNTPAVEVTHERS